MMALVSRRKWTHIAVIVGCVMVVIILTMYLGRPLDNLQSRSKNAQGNIPEKEAWWKMLNMPDPQRNIPAKSKLYDTDVTCEPADSIDTPFLKVLRDNETVVIPEIPVLKTLSREELSALYHTYIETVQHFCRRMRRLGHLPDGGWDVCHDKEFRPKTPCLVYSFGINNDFSFDDGVIEEYGCMVHSFDPSMNTKSYSRSKKNYFHNLGLASENKLTDDGWRINTLETIRTDLKHTKDKISILKMDIELWEWDVLPDIIDDGTLKDVDALYVEFHLNLAVPPTESGRATYLRALTILKSLYDLDFRIFYTHRNPSLIFTSKCSKKERSNCHEVNFQKVKRTN